VRDVREVTGRALFIAGDIGPLGKRLLPDGPLSAEEAAEAFREQVSVLWEAGADLILFETFADLAEIEIGVCAARAVCDLPIVASMTFAEDGLTMTGYAPTQWRRGCARRAPMWWASTARSARRRCCRR
jgi:methionine synthase I (cobalamin-dependent)